jgi:hypothetical protein
MVPPIDPAAAKNAYEALLPRARAMPASEYETARVDLQQAVIIALGVAQLLDKPEIRDRFTLLPTKIFDHRHLDDLSPFALALHQSLVKLQSAEANSSEAMLPVSLVESATEVKKRMIDLCEYVFKANVALSNEVADIKSGTGYKDHALDLGRLAVLYEDHQAVLSKDVFTYRSTDKDDARRLEAAIIHELSQAQSADANAMRAIVTAMWTIMRACYEEVAVTGRYLFRHENGEAMFPSLFQRKRRGPSEPESGESPGSAE